MSRARAQGLMVPGGPREPHSKCACPGRHLYSGSTPAGTCLQDMGLGAVPSDQLSWAALLHPHLKTQPSIWDPSSFPNLGPEEQQPS